MRRAEGYSWLQILIHWLTAGLIAFQLLVNDQIERDFDNRMDGDGLEPSLLGYVHIAVGISILALGILRLVVRYRMGVPFPHSDVPKIFVWTANVTHAALYGLLLAMPLTGLLAWFGHSDIGGRVA